MVRLGRLGFSAGFDGRPPPPLPPSTGGQSHGISGLSTTAIIATSASLTVWNLVLLILSIVVVAAPGNEPVDYTFDIISIGTSQRIGMVFLWCLIPTLTTFVSLIDLFRHRTVNARRAVFSAAFGTSLYAIAFLLWGQCVYLGWSDVCWTGGWSWYVLHDDPEITRYVLPWFALATAVGYFVITVCAVVVLRRQRNHAPSEENYHRNLIVGKKLSIESSEIDTSTIGDQTLQSRPRSTLPSRQVSQANHSTRPPTYYSSADDSLLEKDEKRDTTGYV